MWFAIPETGLGWVFWLIAWSVQLTAVVVILRDARGRRFSGWDVAALVFVVACGPGAAGAFLAVQSVLERRARRRKVVATRAPVA